MQSSSLARLGLFIAIALGGLGGAGAIYNHYFPGGAERARDNAVQIDGLKKNDVRQDDVIAAHTQKITELNMKVSTLEVSDGQQAQEIKTLNSKVSSLSRDLENVAEESASMKASMHKIEETNAKLRKAYETLEDDHKDLKTELQIERDMRKENDMKQEERLKRIERVLGLQPEN